MRRLFAFATAIVLAFGVLVAMPDQVAPTPAAEAVQACIETDGGNDRDKAGFARTGAGTENEVTKVDVCSQDVLTEYYCDSATLQQTTYTCSGGCKNGACLPDTPVSPEVIERKKARAERLAQRKPTRRTREAVSQGDRYKFPSAHSGVRRMLKLTTTIQKPSVVRKKTRTTRERKIDRRMQDRCARMSESRRMSIPECSGDSLAE
jgi:hypothetical protein